MTKTVRIDRIAFRGLADEVRERLRARIFSGELPHGQRIVERELAESLGVSRGPVRDALRMLESEGLVVSTPRAGTRVASLTREDAIEVFAIREALEPLAVRFLIEQNDPAHFVLLQAEVDALRRAAQNKDWVAAILHDLAFHALIFKLSGQRRLYRIFEGLHGPMLQVFGELSHFYQAIDEVPARHQALLDVLRAGDLTTALAQSTDHVSAWRERLLSTLEPHAQGASEGYIS